MAASPQRQPGSGVAASTAVVTLPQPHNQHLLSHQHHQQQQQQQQHNPHQQQQHKNHQHQPHSPPRSASGRVLRDPARLAVSGQ
ncbi:hypothetical protein MNEG_13914, partial [Monoraphidium neglectum]